MNIKITLGKNVNNQMLINHQTVSNHHAIVEFENNIYTITDLESTNGTFVNNARILKKKFTLKDKIRLGNFELDTKALEAKINQIATVHKTDFSEEFNALESIYNEYSKKINQLTEKEKLKPQIIKLVITLSLMGLSYLIFKSTSSMLVVGLISGILTSILVKNSTLKEKTEDITLEYSKQIRCPKCNTELISKSWKYWQTKGKCPSPRCNAHWK